MKNILSFISKHPQLSTGIIGTLIVSSIIFGYHEEKKYQDKKTTQTTKLGKDYSSKEILSNDSISVFNNYLLPLKAIIESNNPITFSDGRVLTIGYGEVTKKNPNAKHLKLGETNDKYRNNETSKQLAKQYIKTSGDINIIVKKLQNLKFTDAQVGAILEVTYNTGFGNFMKSDLGKKLKEYNDNKKDINTIPKVEIYRLFANCQSQNYLGLGNSRMLEAGVFVGDITTEDLLKYPTQEIYNAKIFKNHIKGDNFEVNEQTINDFLKEMANPTNEKGFPICKKIIDGEYVVIKPYGKKTVIPMLLTDENLDNAVKDFKRAADSTITEKKKEFADINCKKSFKTKVANLKLAYKWAGKSNAEANVEINKLKKTLSSENKKLFAKKQNKKNNSYIAKKPKKKNPNKNTAFIGNEFNNNNSLNNNKTITFADASAMLKQKINNKKIVNSNLEELYNKNNSKQNS